MAGKERLAAIGSRYGRWTVLRDVEPKKAPSGRNFRMLVCRCDCGVEKEVYAINVVYGKSTSCGCYMIEQTAKALTKHGHSGNHTTPEYKAWCHMRARVREDSRNSKDYYHRGIKVCDRWLDSFENFLADMGLRPADKRSIDRINNDGNYEPGNCRWADYYEQANNKRNSVQLTFYGMSRSIPGWAKISGVSPNLIRHRIKKGWPVKYAVWANPGTKLADVLPAS